MCKKDAFQSDPPVDANAIRLSVIPLTTAPAALQRCHAFQLTGWVCNGQPQSN